MVSSNPVSRSTLKRLLHRRHQDGIYLDRRRYADEKPEAWHKLGDRLEAILSASNVVNLKSA
jgi:hypothetical protein